MTTRQPYKPKYIPLYVSRTEKKELEPPAAKLEPHDISGLRQQIDSLSEEIRTSPVSYPREPTMAADPHRRFALPTDMSRFERLRQGLRRDEEADINLGANYSRYRLEARQYEEEEPETRTTRISRDKSPIQTSTRLRTYKSPQTPQYEEDHFEDDYPEIKHESEEDDVSMQPTPQLRRYAGYNASSPQKRVTIEEPRPKSRDSFDRPKSRDSFEEATRQAEEQFEQYVSDIEVSLGPEEARRFLREHKHFTHMLHDEYQSLRQKPKRAVKKGIIKKRPDIDYRDIEEEYEEPKPVKHEEKEEYRPEEVKEAPVEKEILRRVLSKPDSVSEKSSPSGIRILISSSYRRVVGAWHTTTSPILLLVTSFFFWQAIRLYVYATLFIFPLYLS